MEIKGSLGGTRLLDLLQSFSLLGRDGRLTVVDSRGPQAEITFSHGRICLARHAHLEAEEALLACLFWYEGEFSFQAVPPGTVDCQQTAALPEHFNLSSFALNAVYWADELEKRRSFIPSDSDPISLQKEFHGEDPFGGGLAPVYEALSSAGSLTPLELDRRLPVAPLKIRLALAYLAENGVISRPETPVRIPTSGTIKKWWLSLAAKFGGGVRVLVILADTLAKENACYSLARSLQKKLKTPEPWISHSVSGPSFLRFKPEPRGILTLCLMSANELQELPEFYAFASAYDVIACAGAPVACDGEHRRTMGVPIIDVPSIDTLATDFLERLGALKGNVI